MHVSQVWCDGESFFRIVLFFFEELNTAFIYVSQLGEKSLIDPNYWGGLVYPINYETV
jgi:hypothetical protein